MSSSTSSTPDGAPLSERSGWLLAGRVGRPHGLDGSFHLYDSTPALLAPGAIVSLDGREVRVTRRAGTDERPIVRLEGYEDRSAAESLRGSELLMKRSAAPELGPDEWWAEDLEGCAVHDGARRIGSVTRLRALPSCEVLEVARDGDPQPLLVPLVSDAVRSVDIQGRQIDVDLRFLGEEPD